jgi:simple sugar transport system ATP-binding protein
MAETSTTAGAPPPAVVMSGITKHFPGGVVANEGVDLQVDAGEVHALLGENGAGKSTLSNILTGLYRADAGEISLFGQPVTFHSPRDAIEAGVGMVHQHFRLVEPLTVAENVVLGMPGRFNRRAAERAVVELGRRYGLPVDPTARVWQLSVGEQQRVEILKVLHRGARILIMDEPTAVLTPQEAETLFATLRSFASEGRAVIFISHKLDEVMSVADRVTVLRDGRTVATVDVAATSTRELARLMVGRDVVLAGDAPAVSRAQGEGLAAGEGASGADEAPVVLAVEDLSATDDRGHPALRSVALEVHAGEVVGVCGVAGNGQRELAEVISGTRRRTAGTVEVGGRPLRGGDAREAIAAGVAHVPEDRLHTGLAPSLGIEDNLVLKSYRRAPMSAGPFLRRSRIRRNAVDLLERFGVKAPSTTTPTRQLSGGNVQKVLLAREFSARPRVLIAASPTRGLDVGAIENVRTMLLDAARDGVGVVLISEDLDEVLALSDRVVVMYDGRVAGSFGRDDADVDEIGLLMGGGHRDDEPAGTAT